MKKTLITLAVLALAAFLFWTFYPSSSLNNGKSQKVESPLNATYLIEGREVKLVDGRAESEIGTSSASKLVTTVFGTPALGDLNGDKIDDAVTLVTQQSGGSGTFYYALVAINVDGEYQGLSAVLLGDRIAPQSTLIKDQVAMVNFADRVKGEPMSTAPSQGVTKYLTVENNSVKSFDLKGKGEQIFVGNLIMAHEVRIFTPCGGTAHWVIGTSTAYADLMKTYNENKSTTSPYSSVYAVVSGVIVSAPTDGFGADYNYGIDVKSLLKTLPSKSCAKI